MIKNGVLGFKLVKQRMKQ